MKIDLRSQNTDMEPEHRWTEAGQHGLEVSKKDTQAQQYTLGTVNGENQPNSTPVLPGVIVVDDDDKDDDNVQFGDVRLPFSSYLPKNDQDLVEHDDATRIPMYEDVSDLEILEGVDVGYHPDPESLQKVENVSVVDADRYVGVQGLCTELTDDPNNLAQEDDIANIDCPDQVADGDGAKKTGVQEKYTRRLNDSKHPDEYGTAQSVYDGSPSQLHAEVRKICITNDDDQLPR